MIKKLALVPVVITAGLVSATVCLGVVVLVDLPMSLFGALEFKNKKGLLDD